MFVPFEGEGDGRVAPVELRVEGDAGQPLPVSRVTGGFVVDEPFLEGKRGLVRLVWDGMGWW